MVKAGRLMICVRMKRASWLTLALAILFLFITLRFVISGTDKINLHHQLQTPDLVRQIQTPDLDCPIPSLSNRTLPITALASFPGSGNTWMRHLLQQLTGILTGSVYTDTKLKENGFPGEGREDGTVIAIKTHRSFSTRYKRAVLIIRNPYEAFLADFVRLHSGHTGQGELVHFKDWTTNIEKSIGSFLSFLTSWLQHEDLLPVFYDALKANLTHELNRLSSFLKKAGVDGKPQCALRNSEGTFHRNSSGVALNFFYNNDQRKKMNGLISQIEGVVSKRFVNMTLPMKNWRM